MSTLPIERSTIRSRLMFAILFLGVALITVYLDLHRGIDFSDEGYLWYGSQRILHGELPIRDFQSYDPGKYAWVALCMAVTTNDGVIIERASSFLFFFFGVACCFALLKNVKTGANFESFVFLLAVLFFVITGPRTHIIDNTATIILVASFTRLLADSSFRNFILHGFVVGLCAFLGRQYGLYSLLALGLASVSVWRGKARSTLLINLAACVAGVFIGYLPMELCILAVPGYFNSFYSSLMFSLAHQNLPLPIPSPWEAFAGLKHNLYRVYQFLLGALFIALPLFDLIGVAYVAWESYLPNHFPKRPLLTASILLSIPYTHYAFARADGPHMVFGSVPFAVGVMCFLGLDSQQKTNLQRILMSMFAITVCTFAVWLHPFIGEFVQGDWRALTIAGERLRASQDLATQVQDEIDLVSKYGGPDHNFLAQPFFAGLYAVFRVKSPTREIFSSVDQPDSEAASEIRRIQASGPNLVLIRDFPLDGMNERRYPIHHKKIYEFITTTYRRIPSPPAQSDLLVFIK